MTNKKKFSIPVAAITAGITLVSMLGLVNFASAQTTLSPKQTANRAARITRVIARSDEAIKERIDRLNSLLVRVGSLKNVSATTKATISSNVQTSITALNALKTKIDADTDLEILLTDAKSITGNYRIYALIIPQGYIAASSDRISTIAAMLSTLGTKLQARISAAQASGKDVTTLSAALTDMKAKIADAQAKGASAELNVSALVPDDGDASKLASNGAAIKAAHTYIKAASDDLHAARKDASTIIAGLKGFGRIVAPSAASGSTSTAQ